MSIQMDGGCSSVDRNFVGEEKFDDAVDDEDVDVEVE